LSYKKSRYGNLLGMGGLLLMHLVSKCGPNQRPASQKLIGPMYKKQESSQKNSAVYHWMRSLILLPKAMIFSDRPSYKDSGISSLNSSVRHCQPNSGACRLQIYHIVFSLRLHYFFCKQATAFAVKTVERAVYCNSLLSASRFLHVCSHVGLKD